MQQSRGCTRRLGHVPALPLDCGVQLMCALGAAVMARVCRSPPLTWETHMRFWALAQFSSDVCIWRVNQRMGNLSLPAFQDTREKKKGKKLKLKIKKLGPVLWCSR